MNKYIGKTALGIIVEVFFSALLIGMGLAVSLLIIW